MIQSKYRRILLISAFLGYFDQHPPIKRHISTLAQEWREFRGRLGECFKDELQLDSLVRIHRQDAIRRLSFY